MKTFCRMSLSAVALGCVLQLQSVGAMDAQGNEEELKEIVFNFSQSCSNLKKVRSNEAEKKDEDKKVPEIKAPLAGGIKKQLDQLKKQKVENEKKIKDLQKQLDNLNALIDASRKAISDEVAKQADVLNKDEFNGKPINEQIDLVVKAIDDMKRTLDTQKTTNDTNTDAMKKIARDYAWANLDANESLESNLGRLEDFLKNLKTTLDEGKKEADASVTTIENLRNDNERLSKNNDDLTIGLIQMTRNMIVYEKLDNIKNMLDGKDTSEARVLLEDKNLKTVFPETYLVKQLLEPGLMTEEEVIENLGADRIRSLVTTETLAAKFPSIK